MQMHAHIATTLRQSPHSIEKLLGSVCRVPDAPTAEVWPEVVFCGVTG